MIGVIEDRSGAASAYSQHAVAALRLAVAQTNAGNFLDASSALTDPAPGILGRPLELIFEDDTSDPNLTVPRTRRLVANGADVIFFLSGSASALQGKVVCQEEEILCLAPNNVHPAIVAPPNEEFIFTLAPDFLATAGVFLQAFAQLGYQTAAYHSDNTATAQAGRDAYVGVFEASGLEFVAGEESGVGSSDVSPQVLRLRQAEPDVVLDFSQQATEGGLFFRTSAELMPGVPRWATNSVTAQPEMWEVAGDGINGLLVVDNATLDNPYTARLADLYASEYGDGPFLFVHSTSWDAVMLLKLVMEQAGSTDGPALRDALLGVQDFPSAHGQPGYTLSFRDGSHNAASLPAHIIIEFVDGRPQTWGQFQPE